MTVSNYTPEMFDKKLTDLAGLSVLMPLPPKAGAGEHEYQVSQFAQDTGWLNTIQERFPSAPPEEK